MSEEEPPRRVAPLPMVGPTDRRTLTTLYVLGLFAVVANSALYFFGVGSLSHPAVSAIGVLLMIPLFYVRRRDSG